MCDQGTLGTRVGIDKATGTYVVDRMTAAGLSVTRTDPDNRRRKLITMTDEGRKALNATIPQAKGAEQLMVERLSKTEISDPDALVEPAFRRM